MNVIRCKNGHFFDGDAYDTCPHCGETAMVATPPTAATEEKKSFWSRLHKDKVTQAPPVFIPPVQPPQPPVDNGSAPTDALPVETPAAPTPTLKKNPTLDFWNTASHSPEPAKAEEAPVETTDTLSDEVDEVPFLEEESVASPIAEQEETPQEEAPPAEKNTPPAPASSLLEAVKQVSASNQGKTMSYFRAVNAATTPEQNQQKPSAEPVVGWLVCVSGCHFGECFQIYAGKNSVGRNSENRIVVPRDNSISRVKHALLVYEPKKRNFFIQPGDSSGLTYLNDEYITESCKLSARDIIELGDSKFLFVPLCGDTFSWEDYMSKGE